MPRYRPGQIGIPRVDILHVTMYVDLEIYVVYMYVYCRRRHIGKCKMPIMTRHFCVTTKPFLLGNFVSDLKSHIMRY